MLGKIKECQEKVLLYRYSCVVPTNVDARAMSELMMEYQIPSQDERTSE